MYPRFSLSGSNARYHLQQALNVLQPRSPFQEDHVSLRCPRYAFQLMAGILEVLNDSHLQDITLVCCDGQRIRTNRVLLSASSPYFRQALAHRGSELYLPGITSEILNVLLVFMFNGDIQVSHCLLPHVIHAATTLQIRGFQDACAMIPSFITGTDNYQEALDIKQEATQPSKKRKLETNDNILESGSASLFRPWSVTVASSKETVSHIHKPDAFKPLTPPAVEHSTASFVIPKSASIYAKPPPMSRDMTLIVPQSQMNYPYCVSPDTSLDFAPVLASTMKNQVSKRTCTSPLSSIPSTNLPANITPTSPVGWSSTLNNTKDFTTPLSGTLEKINQNAHSSEKLVSATSPMSRLNSNDYSFPGSLDEFSTPVSRKLHPLPSFRTPMELLKSDPSSAAGVLCGSLPLLDDSKDGTVVEYRDESDDEGNLVIDLKEN